MDLDGFTVEETVNLPYMLRSNRKRLQTHWFRVHLDPAQPPALPTNAPSAPLLSHLLGTYLTLYTLALNVRTYCMLYILALIKQYLALYSILSYLSCCIQGMSKSSNCKCSALLSMNIFTIPTAIYCFSIFFKNKSLWNKASAKCPKCKFTGYPLHVPLYYINKDI